MTLAILTRPTNITRSTEVPRNPHITSFSPFRLSVFSFFFLSTDELDDRC